MASKFQRENSSFWWVKWRDDQGRIRRESTKYRIGLGLDTRECERHVATLSLKEKTNRIVRNDDHAFSRWVPGFLRVTYANSGLTYIRYLGSWEIIQAFLDENELISPIHVQREHATKYMEWRMAQKIPGLKGKKTVCRNSAMLDLTILRVIMYEAQKRGYIQANPISKLRLKKDAPRAKPEFTHEQITVIREALKDKPDWMRVSFEIALRQGCRFSETCLPMSSIDLDDGTITFVIKGGRKHNTKLHPGLRPMFEKMRADRQAMTYTMPERNSTRDWSRFFKRMKMPGYSFHCTRVTAITMLARAGVNEQQAMAYIGHSHSEIHRIYQRLKARDLSACVEAILVE